MRHIKYLALVCILCGPQMAFAVEQGDHQYTAKENIVFSPESMIAFDRSGKYVTSRTLADGSSITELNGSMRSITVARVGPDGKVETYCTTNAEAARSWMAGEFDSTPAAATMPVRRVK